MMTKKAKTWVVSIISSIVTHIGRDSQQLTLVACKPHRLHERRRKVAESIQRVCHEKVAEGEDPEHGRFQSRDEVGFVKVLVCSFRCIRSHTGDSPLALLGGEELGGSDISMALCFRQSITHSG